MVTDLAAVRADDALIDALADGAPGTDYLTNLLAAWASVTTAGLLPVERVFMSEHRTMTRDALLDEAHRRFGDDLADMAFVCPCCGDVASVREFQKLGAGHRAGSECIGRLFGALQGPRTPGRDGVVRGVAARGCDWTSFGRFPGPWTVVVKPGVGVHSFALAPATVTATPEPVA